MIELFLLSAAVYSLQVSTTVMEGGYPQLNMDSSFSKAELPLRGTYLTCFLMNLTVQNQVFTVMVDTGSTDTALPQTGLSGYSGTPSLNLATPVNGQRLFASYGDSSYWYGYLFRITVAATSRSNITATAPVNLITSQSTSPVFVSGANSQGIMGLAFRPLTATTTNPYSVVDAWFASGVIPRNQIAFHGCPYRRTSDSWIDFGNETPVTKCGNKSATLYMPYVSHVNVEILQIRVGSTSVALPSNFQLASSTSKVYSIIDSCTSLIYIPKSVHDVFLNALINSGAFSTSLTTFANFQDWLSGLFSLKFSASALNYTKLPSITFSLSTGKSDGQMISLTLGPRQYLELGPSGYCKFILTRPVSDYSRHGYDSSSPRTGLLL